MDHVRVGYSTDGGRQDACPACGLGRAACRCAPARRQPAARQGPVLPQDGVVRVWRDRKRRRGKTVTVIGGVPGDPARLAALAAALKRHCGAGGTVQPDGTIEVQGDHRERVAAKLAELGYRVKLAGG